MTSHANPSGDLGDVIGRACDALIKIVERERFAVTSRPRARGARSESEDPTYIPADVQRAVYKRDGGRCTFTNESGERCGERRFLQIDHIVPRALGGKPIADNLRLLCGPHNQYEAERKLGADFMAAKRARAKANAATARERRVREHDAATVKAAASPPELERVDSEEAAAKPAARPFERELVEEAAANPTAPTFLEREVVEALTSLGYKSTEARRAVATTAGMPGATFEDRLRAALASLSRSRPIRCSDVSFDLSAGLPLWLALREWKPRDRAFDS